MNSNTFVRLFCYIAAVHVGLASASGQVPDRLPLSDSRVQSLFVATTRDGKNLSAQQLKPLVLYQTWPGRIKTHVRWHLKIGVFLLGVRSDGAVAKVEALQSTGAVELDRELVRALMKWRFRPNSVNEVRVPAFYYQS